MNLLSDNKYMLMDQYEIDDTVPSSQENIKFYGLQNSTHEKNKNTLLNLNLKLSRWDYFEGTRPRLLYSNQRKTQTNRSSVCASESVPLQEAIHVQFIVIPASARLRRNSPGFPSVQDEPSTTEKQIQKESRSRDLALELWEHWSEWLQISELKEIIQISKVIHNLQL